MMPANEWARVAKGLRLVAADGASRILASAVDVTSNVTTKHLAELADSVAKSTAAMQSSSLANSRSVRREEPRRGIGVTIDGGQHYRSTSREDPVGAGAKQLLGAHSTNAAGTGERFALKSHVIKDGSSMTQTDALKGKRDPANNGVQLETSSVSSTPLAPASIEQADATKKNDNTMSADGENPRQSNNDDIVQLDTFSVSSTSRDPQMMGSNSHAKSAAIDSDEHYSQHLPEGSAVPTSRISRALGFASLGAGLALGSVTELARRTLGQSSSTDPLVLSNDANAQRLSDSLRRMRGAAMKLGQMLSIQDESIAPPALTNALAIVRRGAEAMPQHQLMQQLDEQWGCDWRDRIELEDRPFAAASIGQVHLGTLLSKSTSISKTVTKVAVKVQYPGVADSIESDLSNLSMLINATGLAPPGLFLENVIKVGREELKVECDYRREIANQKRFQSLISSDPSLVADRFFVPEVIQELSTDRILVTELVRGGTIDKVVNLDQAERNRIGRAIMRLTMLELFVWRFMQTDPNWGNFIYDVRTRTTYLIDFGASREFSEGFVRGYLNIVLANANRDEELLMEESIRMGFLTGKENDEMLEAHKLSGFCLGEPFQSYEPYDFKSSKITSRISEHGSVFLKHRLTPPPVEVYTLHRKLAGAYNLCIKLGAKISCRDLLDEVADTYNK
ncbi:hypothetical protein ACHAW5_002592 [Stephanodiscus triporus]|uniref:ABC1 atypical kinase-like domain-containing protein n=1 Tax=Stephanodiscus triporus TaxID=2934178 RepID=A0ABD3MDI9_9STRA